MPLGDANNLKFISVVYLNMFRSTLCASSGELDCVLPHMVFCTGCVGRGRVELGGTKLCALSAHSLRPSAHSLRPPSSTRPQPAQPVQNTICGNTQFYSPEDGHNDVRNMLRYTTEINFRLVASFWFLSLPYQSLIYSPINILFIHALLNKQI